LAMTNKSKSFTGRVVSDRMDKTRVAAVVRTTRHPLYGKTIRRTKKYLFHDENNESRMGDLVRIVETRPLSKRKKWRLAGIVKRSQL
jgi:small subunit ribosomal protein S17